MEESFHNNDKWKRRKKTRAIEREIVEGKEEKQKTWGGIRYTNLKRKI